MQERNVASFRTKHDIEQSFQIWQTLACLEVRMKPH